jgi:mono/diheme cytochrome c family protein
MNRLAIALLRKRVIACAVAAALAGIGTVAAQESADIKRGRYIVQIGGCNDCHTEGYAETAGNVKEELWMTGSILGWRGPWGTTYPANLRLVVQTLTEEEWVKHARREWRPPMPWFNLRDMSDPDLRAVYRYLRHLGPAGGPAPTYVPPEQTPGGPFVQFPPPPK